MGMSYRRAWLLVDAMNRCWREPLVATSPGGAAKGGARLTAAGAQVLALYRGMQEAADGLHQGEGWAQLAQGLLPVPRDHQ